MGDKYVSKPQIINAFQFLGNKTDVPPPWFVDALKHNKIQVTMHEKHGFYISVYGENNHIEKAYINDWICIAEHGKVFVMHDGDFNKYWRPYHDKRKV